MKIKVELGSITDIKCDLLVVNEFENVKKPGGVTGAVDKALSGLISELIKKEEITGKLGETTIIHTQGKIKADRVVVVGLGKQEKFGLEEVRCAAGAAINAAAKVKAKKIATIVHGAGIGALDPKLAATAVVEGSILSDYKFEGYSYKKEEHYGGFQELVIVDRTPSKIKAIKAGAAFGEIIAKAVNSARELVNAPANKATPTYLAGYAKHISTGAKLKCTVYGLAQIKKMGLKAFYEVARGSKEPAQLIVLEWKGAPGKKEKLGIVGKGITFDSGGVSIKPSKKMWEMKTDMAGAAAVIGLMQAVADLKIKKNIIAVVPCTENMPDGGAYKPGDVIGTLSGKTVEILSTDAEGRLVLADGVTYAKKLGATKLIDIATLTGSCISALGDVASGVMTNDQEFLNDLLESSKISGEKMWQLPLYEEYKEYSKSKIADIKNCTESGKAGTAIGGLFIKLFVEDTPWIHIDIAGTAFLERERHYMEAGGTGTPIRTLLYYLS